MESLLLMAGLFLFGGPSLVALIALFKTRKIKKLRSELDALQGRHKILSHSVKEIRSALEKLDPEALKSLPPTTKSFLEEEKKEETPLPEKLPEIEIKKPQPAKIIPAGIPLSVPPPPASPYKDTQTNTAQMNVMKESSKSIKAVKPKIDKNWEEIFAKQILPKVAISAGIMGAAFAMILWVKSMGPGGKIFLGYLSGIALMVGGVFAERKERYQVIGRSLLAGSWALIYFITFAMYKIPASQVIHSQILGLFFLLLAGAGAVLFSLRYQNEWTTVASFLLIFLTLAIASDKPEVTFNLASTLIIAAGIGFLAYWKNWYRLLAIGLMGTWFTMGLWLIPLVQNHQFSMSVGQILLWLIATWAAFQIPTLFWEKCQTEGENFQIWLPGTFIANLLGGFGSTLYLTIERAPQLDHWVALLFGLIYIGFAFHFEKQKVRGLYLLSATVGLASLIAFLPPLALSMGHNAIHLYRILGIELVLVAGIFLKERYFRGLAYGAFAVTFFEIISLKLSGNRFLPFLGEQFDYRIFMLSLCTIVCLANVYFLNFPWKKHLKDWESNATTLFSVSATLMVILLTWLEVPETLVSAILGGTALVWYLVGRYTNLKDFLAESCILLITGFFALLHFHINQTTSGTHLHHGVLPFLILSLFAYGIYFLVRFPGKKLDQDLTTALSQFAPIYSLMGGITICLLITWRLPDEWIAPGLALVLAWYVALGVGFQWRDLCAEALLITLGVVLELVFTSWSLAGNTFGIPSRVVSVGAVILLLYCCQYLILRTLKDNQKLFMDKSSDSFFAFAYLLIPTLFFAALVKAEALTFNKNLLVALAWSGLGAIYLEISSIVRSKTWFYQGQALIAAGTVHLFMVNFVQVGYFGPLSLRLLTVIPFLGILAYGYFSWPGHGRDIKISKEQDDFRDTYLFGIVIVIATFILYEFHRAWVLVGWAGLSFGLLLSWQKTGNKHLRLLGSVMALASLGRVLGSNLYYRDQTLFSRPNLITIPLTCILILLDYGLLRRLDIGLGTTKPDPREKTFVNLLSRGRMVFLFTFIIILTSFIWVELSKAILTGFLGLEALLLVGIGFLAKEKLARLLGLGILVFCMVKLVLHDLTLSMGARAVVFIFSAAIMFGVSFIYTRFEKRLKEFL